MMMIDIKYKANVTHIEKKLEQRNIDKTED